MNINEEITKWYAEKAREQTEVRQAMSDHYKVCSGGDCRECRQLEHRFNMSSMGD